ncbi:MAG: FMN-binding protein [Clostridia bacterium]|nr:FMN-binding protein [Clostridia bacterium]
MKKILSIALIAVMLLSIAAFAQADALTGIAKGFGGELTVTVETDGDKIVNVTVDSHSETPNIGTRAIDELPAKIAAANSADVDAVASATVTSNAIIAAVKNALDPVANPYEAPAPVEVKAQSAEAAEAYIGLGVASTGRKGPGSDDQGTQVWSFNQVIAAVVFDGEGRILLSNVDQLEIATPNYDGSTMPHLSGFPGQGGYNLDSDHDAVVDGKTEDTEENFMAEVASWQTKRERGEGYVMGTGYWAQQMDKFQTVFAGKTVEEVKDWFAAYCSDSNGRPMQAGNEKDAAKYDALSDEEKAMLADVTSAATMSLNDSHGNIIAALEKAYANHVPLNVESAAAMGLGVVNTGRKGPGSDDQGTQVWSFNDVYVATLFDAEGKIVAMHADQLEVATPNYDGSTMPHFSGFPGQGGYNLDSDHDAVVDGKTEDTEEAFMAEVASWQTKRERGEGYVMGTGYWAQQMDKFQETFVGMTAEEVEAWFAAYCSDNNGRPMQAGNEKDAAKYDALSDEEKAMLADVTSAATMSLRDSHGDILAAIVKSAESKVDVQLTIGK